MILKILQNILCIIYILINIYTFDIMDFDIVKSQPAFTKTQTERNTMLTDKLIEKIKEKNNPTCVGLDTCIDYIPKDFLAKYKIESLNGSADAIYDYNRELIDTLYKFLPSVKIQNAYYEMYGIPGIEAYKKTIDYAHKAGLIVIADVKRGDIGSTSGAYSKAHLSPDIFDSDFMTVNPYFGTDGLKPFLEDCEKLDKGLFVLVKTSNPSSSELQDLILDDGEKLFFKTADLVIKWGGEVGRHGYNRIGAVVGATHRLEGEELRAKMKNTFFLIPGYGAQGAGADDIAGMFDKNKTGGIINSSRGIICAWKKSGSYDFKGSALKAVIDMRDDINGALDRRGI